MVSLIYDCSDSEYELHLGFIARVKSIWNTNLEIKHSVVLNQVNCVQIVAKYLNCTISQTAVHSLSLCLWTVLDTVECNVFQV